MTIDGGVSYRDVAVGVGAVLGLCVGSFLNVVIWRVPRGESIVTPPSHCPTCDRVLKPSENIPLFSWVIQRGRCRGCGSAISARYPLVELGTAVAFVWAAIRATSWLALLPTWAATASLVALAAIWVDLRQVQRTVLWTAVGLAALVVVAKVVAAPPRSAAGTAGIGFGLLLGGTRLVQQWTPLSTRPFLMPRLIGVAIFLLIG